MITKAVTIHGKNDLRLEEVNLPEVGPDDVQIRVVCDSICMSTYKAALEGEVTYLFNVLANRHVNEGGAF